jgi:Flp pilus assembly protein TadD
MKRAFLPSSPIQLFFLAVTLVLAACNSETLQKQAAQIKEQEAEIARQQKEIEELSAAQKLEQQKRRDCNRAFREYFDKAQAARDRNQAIALYREGLGLCPDDDVAHFEFGKVLAASGSNAEAEKEFEAALKINPNFGEAKAHLDAVQKPR